MGGNILKLLATKGIGYCTLGKSINVSTLYVWLIAFTFTFSSSKHGLKDQWCHYIQRHIVGETKNNDKKIASQFYLVTLFSLKGVPIIGPLEFQDEWTFIIHLMFILFTFLFYVYFKVFIICYNYVSTLWIYYLWLVWNRQMNNNDKNINFTVKKMHLKINITFCLQFLHICSQKESLLASSQN